MELERKKYLELKEFIESDLFEGLHFTLLSKSYKKYGNVIAIGSTLLNNTPLALPLK